MRFQNYAAAIISKQGTDVFAPKTQPPCHKIQPTDMKYEGGFSTPAFSLNRSKERSHRSYSGCMLVSKSRIHGKVKNASNGCQGAL